MSARRVRLELVLVVVGNGVMVSIGNIEKKALVESSGAELKLVAVGSLRVEVALARSDVDGVPSSPSPSASRTNTLSRGNPRPTIPLTPSASRSIVVEFTTPITWSSATTAFPAAPRIPILSSARNPLACEPSAYVRLNVVPFALTESKDVLLPGVYSGVSDVLLTSGHDDDVHNEDAMRRSAEAVSNWKG